MSSPAAFRVGLLSARGIARHDRALLPADQASFAGAPLPAAPPADEAAVVAAERQRPAATGE